MSPNAATIGCTRAEALRAKDFVRIIDAKYKMAVIPRSHGFLVTIPHAYQAKLPDGAKEMVNVKAVGSAN